MRTNEPARIARILRNERGQYVQVGWLQPIKPEHETVHLDRKQQGILDRALRRSLRILKSETLLRDD